MNKFKDFFNLNTSIDVNNIINMMLSKTNVYLYEGA